MVKVSLVASSSSSLFKSFNVQMIVPRPLFIEEFGLAHLMSNSAIPALSLAQTAFEEGKWSDRILQAYERGRSVKEVIRHGQRHPAQSASEQNGGDVIVREIMKFLESWKGGDG